VALLKRIPLIKEVQYGEEWVKRFTTFMNFMRLVGALLGGFLVLAVIFIVSNTIKLTIYSRKEELELLGLVGATRLFIKAPFLIEGLIQERGAPHLVMLWRPISGFCTTPAISQLPTVRCGLSFLPNISSGYFRGMLLGFLGA
jgi:cell division transport system permease protein